MGEPTTYCDLKAEAWAVRPRWRLSLTERRLRWSRARLDVQRLTQLYATRSVLRERGRKVPPITRTLP